MNELGLNRNLLLLDQQGFREPRLLILAIYERFHRVVEEASAVYRRINEGLRINCKGLVVWASPSNGETV